MAAISKVLIVDDELDICYLLSGMLKQWNFQAGFVNSLSDAVVALQNDSPDVLFLDNHLPDGFGLDFIPFVKKNYPGVKVVMITAHDSAAERNTAYKGGVDLFIAKPLNRKVIVDAMNKLSGPPGSTGRVVFTQNPA